MTIESATYISSLNSSYPESTSQKKDGDNHLRLIKATLLATFPNINAAMTASDEELNFLVGVTSAVQTQINTKGAHAGQTWTGTHDFTVATASFGSPTMTTQAYGDNTTKGATTAFVVAAVIGASSNIPGQTGYGGTSLSTDGTTAGWGIGSAALPLHALGIV